MPWTQEERETAFSRHAEGFSAGQTAKILGKTRNAVIGLLNRAGLRCRVGSRQMGTRQAISSPRSVKRPLLKVASPPPDPPAPKLFDGIPATIETATFRMCRFIADEPARADSPICGHKTSIGSAWCEYHRSICFTPSPQHRKTAREKSAEAEIGSGIARAFG